MIVFSKHIDLYNSVSKYTELKCFSVVVAESHFHHILQVLRDPTKSCNIAVGLHVVTDHKRLSKTSHDVIISHPKIIVVQPSNMKAADLQAWLGL